MPRAYHSGDHEEIARDARRGPRARRAGRPSSTPSACRSAAARCSTGWAARARDAARVVAAAAAVSTPLDLTAAGIAIGQGLNRIYTRHFLRTLKPKSLAMARRFPGLLDARAIARARTMYEFDDAVTAPLHGFAGTPTTGGARRRKPWLAGVAVPTLVLNARNDPFVPRGIAAGPARGQRATCCSSSPTTAATSAS